MTITIDIPDESAEAVSSALQSIIDGISAQKASAETPAPGSEEGGDKGLGSLMNAGSELDAMSRASGKG